jgi:hypothetical protein
MIIYKHKRPIIFIVKNVFLSDSLFFTNFIVIFVPPEIFLKYILNKTFFKVAIHIFRWCEL